MIDTEGIVDYMNIFRGTYGTGMRKILLIRAMAHHYNDELFTRCCGRSSLIDLNFKADLSDSAASTDALCPSHQLKATMKN